MKKLFTILALIALTAGSIGMSSARQPASNKAQAESVAGVFDYYLLALSWSPTFCLSHKDDAQCTGKGYGFVLHGLWPQYAKGGWPESCPPLTRLSAAETSKGLTMYPTKKTPRSRMGQARHLQRSRRGGLSGQVRSGPRRGEDSAGVTAVRLDVVLLRSAGNCRSVSQGQSGYSRGWNCSGLQRPAAVGSAGVHGQGFAVRRVWQRGEDAVPRGRHSGAVGTVSISNSL